ncbi:hypothetical protein RclHR1_02920013 [Rhizophagus clarus]|uniref:SAM domain-containing protein n=1 Tax=Rhizophagus clarus TaxID=94130 RepID=A0A2Z6RZ92_9GLOM|nr:hypothetical protein RclHR1_02920013 [Rhizophagus clarus]
MCLRGRSTCKKVLRFRLDTETLIVHLKEQDDNDDFKILRNEKITGQDFLDMTKEDFQSYGLKEGPAMRLAKEAKALKNNTQFDIEFTEESLVEGSEEYQTLRKGVRKVLGIIVGLLKDKACAEEEPERKRARIEDYRYKK